MFPEVTVKHLSQIHVRLEVVQLMADALLPLDLGVAFSAACIGIAVLLQPLSQRTVPRQPHLTHSRLHISPVDHAGIRVDVSLRDTGRGRERSMAHSLRRDRSRNGGRRISTSPAF